MRYSIDEDNELKVYNEDGFIILMCMDSKRWYICDYYIDGIGGKRYYYRNSVGLEQIAFI